MLGYASEEYARSLAEFGESIPLPRSGGWLLSRKLPGDQGRDATGCYPLFSCLDWQGLEADLRDLPADIVAVSLVADPAADVAPLHLKQSFPDVCRHYKDHYFADLTQPLESFVASHHQRNARQASKSLRIERLERPVEHLATWNSLYGRLIERHEIRGQAAFSPEAFQRQLGVPSLRAYAAVADGQIEGIVLWILNGTTAYYHLAAYSDLGYDLKASFAIFWHSLSEFAAEGIQRAAMGGGAGTFAASEGLSRFKQGWSNKTRPAYFCGRILDAARYAELTSQAGAIGNSFFPAYRSPAVHSQELHRAA